MVMASRASDGECHEGFSKSIGTIHHIFCLKLFFHDTAFHVLLVVAVEGRGDDHVAIRIGHQVTRQLFMDEAIVTHVSVESIDDPVAVRRHIPHAIDRITMGICIASEIQPFSCHPFSVMW